MAKLQDGFVEDKASRLVHTISLHCSVLLSHSEQRRDHIDFASSSANHGAGNGRQSAKPLCSPLFSDRKTSDRVIIVPRYRTIHCRLWHFWGDQQDVRWLVTRWLAQLCPDIKQI